MRTNAHIRTVRDAAFEVLRAEGMTTLFANPGSTEVPFLAGLPDDLRFVLALHEGTVVGAATGWALTRDAPALVLLHTTAGLGNAVGALATARENRAPLVVLVGQQDRRHLVQEPFLAGRLEGLAGDYPVRCETPPRAQDVPGALARAAHAARAWRGPALVVVPMDDWAAPAEDLPLPAPVRRRQATAADPDAVEEVAGILARSSAPALVVGAAADTAAVWSALTGLAERLRCPVWQEAFGARAGFPQDHPQFAGHLPADRERLREVLSDHDLVLVVGAPVLRQYGYRAGPLVPAGSGTRLVLVTDQGAEAERAPVELAAVAPLASFCAALTERISERSGTPAPRFPRANPPAPPEPGEHLRAGHVLAALAERLSPDTVVVEETPSSRPALHALLPARRPLGFLSAAMGGLGFALPAAVGARMADPGRPVVAVVGDGSSLYQPHALWTAAHYGVGVLFVVLTNGRYAILDQLAAGHRARGPWPPFPEIDLTALAASLSCPARKITDPPALLSTLDSVLPTLAHRTEPLLLDVRIAP
ncbi:thiamine pyrophosphate-dependent enzyme [Streptomyces sp. PU-14G]|uniref:thiamine pyrophosphate-dependent enzyme n=1 Tax=Streptomyces sp. PU-14G TaxID=2800808 RepID=UPI0034DED2A1